jgi:hypothetical protein
MFNHKRFTSRNLLPGLALLVASCSGDGLIGGKITAQFSGIKSVQVTGPESVMVDWVTDRRCASYQILKLPNLEPIQTATLPPVKLLRLTPSQTFNFAVSCSQDTGAIGLEKSISVTTWSRFDGKLNPPVDQPDAGTFEVSWNYFTDPLIKFQLYARELVSSSSSAPALGNLVPGCVIRAGQNKVTVGSPDCPFLGSGLKSGSIYEFRVVAVYPDGSDSRPYQILSGQEYSVVRAITASFEKPNCTLSPLGLGADQSTTILTLRCAASTSPNACPLNYLSVQAKQNGQIVSEEMKMSLDSPAILEIFARSGQGTSSNDRIVENLQLVYKCTKDGEQTSIIPIENPKPALKFGSLARKYEYAPEQSYQRNPQTGDTSIVAPSNLGTAIAVGDLDCNGKPDLALGLPKITYNMAPYFNQTPESGAVKIYYNYTQSDSGSISASQISILSFKDLGESAHFGASVSIGNINRDVAKGPGGPDKTDIFFSCDDLIVGAPYETSSLGAGRAFVFYGQPGGISNSTNQNISDLRSNQPTCNGDFDNLSCTPVALVPNLTSHFGVNPKYTQSNASTATYGRKSDFGYKVSYVGDFTADGYGDFVVTDPNCSWDGLINRSLLDGQNNRMTGVGCAYLFFGGPNGIKNDQYVGNASYNGDITIPSGIPNSGPDKGKLYVPFVKFYPPIPQAGMHFGASISGGVEIDGRLPVQVPMPGDGLILASGSDFIIGAPDFQYSSFNSQGSYDAISPWNSNAPDPMVSPDLPTSGDLNGRKFTPPFNLAWAPSASWMTVPVPASSSLQNSSGIAFAYFGRHSFKDFKVKLSEGAKKFPHGTLTCSGCSSDPAKADRFTSQLSVNIRDRRNGSLKLKPAAAVATIMADKDLNPEENFFNCGTRGGSRVPTIATTGLYHYDHLSCLAGRNNFSIIFPDLKSTDSTVAKFGSQVGVAGTKEENAIALYNISATNETYLPGDSFRLNETISEGTVTSSQLVYNPQNRIHDRIKGSPLWEVAVSPFHDGSGNDFSGTTSTIDDSLSQDKEYDIRRAPIFEEIQSNPLSGSPFSVTQGESIVQNDINRDGYGDILISSDPVTSSGPGRIFTYFGNFAGDFAYTTGFTSGADRFHSGAECLVGVDTPTLSATTTIKSGSTTALPFRTFESKSNSSLSGLNFNLTARYPYQFLPSSGGSYYHTNLDGVTPGSSFTRGTNTGSSCKPQVITHAYGAATGISVADLDRDGMSDLLIGFANHNSNSGIARILSSSINSNSQYFKTGKGLSSVSEFSIDTPFSRMGSAVSATDWKFRPVYPETDAKFLEYYRRDAWVGASGRDNGSGAVYNYKSSGYAQMAVSIASSSGSPLLDSSNVPNNLSAEHSRMIGDVNGDGKDDLLVPVQRRDALGNVYFDAILYFGSTLGPITNSYCKQIIGSLSSLPVGGGTALDPKLCLGTSSPLIAYLNGTPIPLPQYLSKPNSVSGAWALYSFPAGDVNRDGKDDVVTFDSIGNLSRVYLFFGYPGGLDVSIPTRADGTLHAQLVTERATVDASSYARNQLSYASFYANIPIRHGDFNGDGFEDLAIGDGGAYGPMVTKSGSGVNKGWKCSPQYYDGVDNDYTQICAEGASLREHGAVTILYGGSFGYQAPATGDFNLSQVPRCNDFYGTCSTSETFSANVKGVYGALKKDAQGGGYSYDSTLTPCTKNTSGGANPCSGRASRIVNPVFYNINDSFLNLENMRFGDSISVGDYNGDGIDDLAVGMSRYWVPDFGNPSFTGVDQSMRNFGVQAGTTADTQWKGAVFIYYGSPYGVLAPTAKEMVADYGLAIDANKSSTNAPVFTLSPPVWNASSAAGASLATPPKLDQHSSAGLRFFGSNLASGDFDAIKTGAYPTSDLAVASGNGQIYVYYGPFCAADNDQTNWYQQTYSYHNLARTADEAQAGYSDQSHLRCSVLDMKALTTTASPSVLKSVTKSLLPQLIEISDTIAPVHRLGTTLLAKMPKEGGNINGDGANGDAWLGTSDLVIGSDSLNDPSIQMSGNKKTGMGYIFFGHPKSATGDSFQTTPGLYVGPPDLRAALRAEVVDDGNGTNITRYHYAPMQLRPFDANLLTGTPTGQFFSASSWIGDLNGDKSGDLIMPTPDLQRGSDSGATPVVSGGGFTLWY